MCMVTPRYPFGLSTAVRIHVRSCSDVALFTPHCSVLKPDARRQILMHSDF